MGQKIAVVPFNQGLRNDVLPFNVSNDSFPVLRNAYQWRGRIRRKRGTTRLGRLTNYFDSNRSDFYPPHATVANPLSFDGSGNANLITGFASSSIPTTAAVIPGTLTITVGANTYTDPSVDGTLSPAGTINYATGAINIPAEAGNAGNALFKYYANLPVMGLETLNFNETSAPGEIGFNTDFSYNISTAHPYNIHNVSFYKNPATGTYTNYIQKTTWTQAGWNGENYRQFGSVNYEGAFWAANGISVPFLSSNVGMQFKAITGATIDAAGAPARVTFTIAAHGLVVGDFVFINEVAGINGLNFQTGFVIATPTAGTVQVEFPSAVLTGAYSAGGIAQYLTSSADPTKDCMRIYDGAPVDNASPPVFQVDKGWVNFTPPIISGPNTVFPIADLPPNQYYLVTARIIIPFKDRLLFIGPVIENSSGGVFYLQDTVIYSENGTPYYTASFDYSSAGGFSGGNVPTSSDYQRVSFLSILTPADQTGYPPAWINDIPGYGGFVKAGFQQPILSIAPNEDVLIMGFSALKARLVYSGNDILPFGFFVINSEYGSLATFSAINFDKGMIDVGNRGITLTTQTGAQRIDEIIPDEVFQINLKDNGPERICSQRDFINEWIYFTYSPSSDYSTTNTSPFPSQTLFYNYRDQSWGIFSESYTTYGQFRISTNQLWDDLTTFTWDEWTDSWDAGENTLLQPEIIAGNQQGFVVFRAEGTGEDPSLYISDITGNTVTCPSHSLDVGDYIIINGALGPGASKVNGLIFSVMTPSFDGNSFMLSPSVSFGAGDYIGGGTITRMYVPYIQTRQFPLAWEMGRKTRIGTQFYLLDTTANGQLTLLLFLSQNAINPYNLGPIVPDPLAANDSLIYSTTLYTCPESTNLGLTPANTNLQMLTGSQSQQLWHRVNTSLIGDTVQLGFTLSDEQMRDTTLSNQFTEITLHSFIIDISPSQLLA